MPDMNIPQNLGKIQKQMVLNINPSKKTHIFDVIIKFMEFRGFSLTDSVRPTYAFFKKKIGWLSNEVIKVRIKDLDDQVYILVGTNRVSAEEKERFHDDMDALSQFIVNKKI